MIYFVYVSMLILSMLLGGVLASGVFCMILRKRSGTSWTEGRSHCDSCGRTLTAIDLIPVISYIALGGKCRTCKAAIPVNGFRVELVWSLAGGVLCALFLGAYENIVMCAIVAVLVLLAAVIVLGVNLPLKDEGKEQTK